MPEHRNIIQGFMKLAAENKMLKQQLEGYAKQHNELYAAMISFLIQNGKVMRLKKENVMALHLGEYKIETVDDGGEEIVYRLKWVGEPS